MKSLVSGLVILLMASGLALANVTVSGTQTRGRGADGKLHSTGVVLQDGGPIIRASDSGAGFWLESDSGQVLRFYSANEAVGTLVPAATWRAYPNLYPGHDEASVAVVIGAAGTTTASPPSTPSGTSPAGLWDTTIPGSVHVQLRFTGSGSSWSGQFFGRKGWENMADLKVDLSTGKISWRRPLAWSNESDQFYSATVTGSTMSGRFDGSSWSGKRAP